MTFSGEQNQDTMPVVVITGATATGKTSLAVEVAHQLGSEIISADSRQVYRGLDIGTGKDLDEYSAVSPPVPYHLIDMVDPTTVYTLYHFQRDCYQVLREAHERAPFSHGTPIFLAGGTPLYIAAVLHDYRIPHVPENSELRRRLGKLPLPELVQRLGREGPELLDRTDTSTARRVVRALEIADYGKRHTIRYTESLPCPLRTTVYAMKVDRALLHRRIDRRLEARLEEGLVDEVQGLLNAGVSAERMQQLGLEYREVCAFLTGLKSHATMVRDLKTAIHRFARRQEIWFRGFERKGIPVRWITPDDSAAVRAAAQHHK